MILRDGTRRLLANAVGAEVIVWIEAHTYLNVAARDPQVVRNRHLPDGTIQTGQGDIQDQQPRGFTTTGPPISA